VNGGSTYELLLQNAVQTQREIDNIKNTIQRNFQISNINTQQRVLNNLFNNSSQYNNNNYNDEDLQILNIIKNERIKRNVQTMDQFYSVDDMFKDNVRSNYFPYSDNCNDYDNSNNNKKNQRNNYSYNNNNQKSNQNYQKNQKFNKFKKFNNWNKNENNYYYYSNNKNNKNHIENKNENNSINNKNLKSLNKPTNNQNNKNAQKFSSRAGGTRSRTFGWSGRGFNSNGPIKRHQQASQKYPQVADLHEKYNEEEFENNDRNQFNSNRFDNNRSNGIKTSSKKHVSLIPMLTLQTWQRILEIQLKRWLTAEATMIRSFLILKLNKSTILSEK